MSKYNNANVDHYKTAGREPQGRAVRHQIAKKEFGTTRAAANQPKGKRKKAG
jgi:hypothetical protein